MEEGSKSVEGKGGARRGGGGRSPSPAYTEGYGDYNDGRRVRSPIECQCSCHNEGRGRSPYHTR